MSNSLASNAWTPRDQWDALIRGEACPLCQAIHTTVSTDAYGGTITDLPMSRLRLARNQFVPGYCVLICNQHVQEPYHLARAPRLQFFDDMTLAAQALDHVFKPIKMNFQLLGNAVPHLHVHLVPRYYGDAAPAQPINPDMQVVHLTRTAFEAQIQAIRAAITPLMTA